MIMIISFQLKLYTKKMHAYLPVVMLQLSVVTNSRVEIKLFLGLFAEFDVLAQLPSFLLQR